MVAKVFIDGEAGTTGLQIRERLTSRRDLEVLSIDTDLRKDLGERKRLLNAADIAILCLPDAAARESVSLVDNPDTRIIDASTAHRVADGWVYGFPEMEPGQQDKVASAKRVANPGCYPQGLIGLIRPLIEGGLLPAEFPVSYNAMSGYTGGGKQLIGTYEASGSVQNPMAPYALTCKHKHVPEMTHYSGLAHAPLFMPSVGPYAQGILGQIPLQLWAIPGTPSVQALHSCITDWFAGADFVEVAPLDQTERSELLSPQALNGTNVLRLHVFGSDDSRQAILMAVYDNLGKGASGAAVQCLNLMLGLNAAEGLTLQDAA